MLTLLIIVVVVALAFDFINGFHDAANAIATSVATGVMSVRTAVAVSGIFNFFGALAGTAVASFIASGLVADPSLVTPAVVLAALIGASAWNLITWWWGIPSSSSHALVGGLAGAVVAYAGPQAFLWGGLVQKVVIPLVVSPVVGLIIAFLMMVAAMWICRSMRPTAVNSASRLLQFASACTLSFAHGMNDAQKVMGVITLALATFMAGYGLKPLLVPAHGQEPAKAAAAVAAYDAQLIAGGKPGVGARADAAAHAASVRSSSMPAVIITNAEAILPTAHLVPDKKKEGAWKEANNVPFWAILACALAMCLGTMAGGKRIIKTMGSKIIRLSPIQGFAAQTSGTAVILAASAQGIPLSTTHCITASIMGAGAVRGLGAIRWNTAISIVIAWVLTLPASALVAWLALYLVRWSGLGG